MEIALATVAIAVLLVANAFATRAVWRDKFAERHQRALQLLAVWLVPVFGAILVLALHRKAEEPSRKYRESPDPGDDFAASGKSARSIQSAVDD